MSKDILAGIHAVEAVMKHDAGNVVEIMVADAAKNPRLKRLVDEARELDIAQGGAQARVLLANLPGYPDNLMRGTDGKIWMGLTKPRSPVVDGMAEKPFLRAMTLRLPRALWPVPKAYGHVMAFTEDGKININSRHRNGRPPVRAEPARQGPGLDGQKIGRSRRPRVCSRSG